MPRYEKKMDVMVGKKPRKKEEMVRKNW
jgi:hypothetical protein